MTTSSNELVGFGAKLNGELAAQERMLDSRLGDALPAVVKNGEVNTALLLAANVPQAAGQIVLAKAMPDLTANYAQAITDLEAEGRTAEAVKIYERSQQVSSASLRVLGAARDALYTDDGNQTNTDDSDTVITTEIRKDGQLTVTGAVLTEYAESLTMQIQTQFTPQFNVEDFVETVVKPSAGLVRSGINPVCAVELANFSGQSDKKFSLKELVELAKDLGADLSDESDIQRLEALVISTKYNLVEITGKGLRIDEADPETVLDPEGALVLARIEEMANELLGVSSSELTVDANDITDEDEDDLLDDLESDLGDDEDDENILLA